MSTPTPEAQPPVIVEPSADSRLAQLHAQYADAKAAADAAAEHLKTITDGIKAELANAAPGQEQVTLRGAGGPVLALAYAERWTVDSRKLKAEDPETYVRFAKKGGAWSLKVVRAAGGDD